MGDTIQVKYIVEFTFHSDSKAQRSNKLKLTKAIKQAEGSNLVKLSEAIKQNRINKLSRPEASNQVNHTNVRAWSGPK